MPRGGRKFRTFLRGRSWTGAEGPVSLFNQAVGWLRRNRVLLPGVSVLAKQVAAVRSRRSGCTPRSRVPHGGRTRRCRRIWWRCSGYRRGASSRSWSGCAGRRYARRARAWRRPWSGWTRHSRVRSSFLRTISMVAGWGGSSVHGYVILSRPRRYTPIVESAGRARPLRRGRESPRSTAPTTRCWPC
nr:DUF4158 domain-containing protein [Streptomyces flaveus]